MSRTINIEPCKGCGGDLYHYAGCAYGEHGETLASQERAKVVANLRARITQLESALASATPVIEILKSLKWRARYDDLRGQIMTITRREWEPLATLITGRGKDSWKGETLMAKASPASEPASREELEELASGFAKRLNVALTENSWLRKQLGGATRRVAEWEEREAKVCPEDFSFEEVIAKLRATVSALKEDAERLNAWEREAGRNLRVRDEPDDKICNIYAYHESEPIGGGVFASMRDAADWLLKTEARARSTTSLEPHRPPTQENADG